MRMNFPKTKAMTFNVSNQIDFSPKLTMDGQDIQTVEEMRILGLVIRSDLKWSSNTENLVSRAYKKLWMLRRLKIFGAAKVDLVDIYTKHVRSILELAVPAWHSGLTVKESVDIERVQKAALRIILSNEYNNYTSALETCNLSSLKERRIKLCLKFANKSEKHPKHTKWFKRNERIKVTRHKQPTFCPVFSRTKRFENSPLSYLTKLLNDTNL